MRVGLHIAVALIFSAATGEAASPTVRVPRSVRAVASSVTPLVRTTDPPVGWARALPAIRVHARNTDAVGDVRLYAEDGSIDREGLAEFLHVANEGQRLDPRVVQLALRAAYHFHASGIEIVSATRKGAHGKHGTGSAIDFQLPGTSAAALAAYLRTTPRAGVGIYTHPKTQYVHLDVRDHSYHWLDASPPHVTWRERLLADPKQAERDAAYVPAGDLPEAAK